MFHLRLLGSACRLSKRSSTSSSFTTLDLRRRLRAPALCSSPSTRPCPSSVSYPVSSLASRGFTSTATAKASAMAAAASSSMPTHSASSSSCFSKETLDHLLEYWFDGVPEDRSQPFPDKVMKKWFIGDSEVDAHCNKHYADAIAECQTKSVDELEASVKDSPKHALALIILLDQMPRNIYRGQEARKAYELTDPKALELCKRFTSPPYEYDRKELWPSHCYQMFMTMPLMHSEALADHKLLQEKCHKALAQCTTEEEKKSIEQWLKFEENHCAVIEKFGRYPSRNACLGRKSTPEEEEHIKSGPGW